MSIFKKRQKQVKENKDDVLSNLDKFKNKKIPEDIKLDSTSAMDLYKEAIV